MTGIRLLTTPEQEQGTTVRESPDCENRPFFLSGRTRESLLAQLICDLRQPLNLTKKLVEVLI